jgi:signal peptide peptidase SppA
MFSLGTQSLRFIADGPLAIRAEVLNSFVELLTLPPNVAIPRAAGERRPMNARPAAVGLWGLLFPRENILTELGYGTALDTFAESMRELADDPSVSEIVVHVDSPGGSVYGVPEAAEAVSEAASVKPVTAAVDSEAASAAYWIASQASELVMTDGGQVGSVGVYVQHVDNSQALAKAGKVVSLLSAGERKTAGHPYGPLDAVGRDELQASVDDYYNLFTRAVARGRNTTPGAVRGGFGRGGMVRADQAVREGMADRVLSFDKLTKEKLGEQYRSSPSGRASLDRGAIEVRKRRLQLDSHFKTTVFESRCKAILARRTNSGPVTQCPTRNANLWATCLHESGHGVAAVALGIPFASISAVPNADSAGRLEWCNSDAPRLAHDEAIAVLLWSGPAAEAMNELSRHAIYIGAKDASLIGRFCPDRAKQLRSRETAIALVANHAHAVRLVAAKLLAAPTRTLTSEHVAALCRDAGLPT